MAMEYFKKASDQGHPHSAYNLAIGHLKGMKTNIDQTYNSFIKILSLISN